MHERKITEREEEVYRLVCPDFDGLSRKEAAQRMGITVGDLSRLLKNMEKKAPQLFPILTKLQHSVFNLVVEDKLSRQEIADLLKCDVRRVDEIVRQIRDKGFCTSSPKTIQFENWMEDKVVRKF